MRILPAAELINVFAALQNLKGIYERSIDVLSDGNADELDENHFMREYLHNDDFQVHFT